jgi:hypothetical protein
MQLIVRSAIPGSSSFCWPRTKRLLVAIFASVLAVSCQNSSEEKSRSANRSSASEGSPILAIVRSRVRGIPVPVSATLVEGSTSSNRVSYRLPPDEPISKLLGFYSQTMPPQRPHEGLESCGRQPIKGAVTSMQLLWRMPGTTDFVEVILMNDSSGVVITITDRQNERGYECRQLK